VKPGTVDEARATKGARDRQYWVISSPEEQGPLFDLIQAVDEIVPLT
jgi:hypothetical protein